jgi:DNA polymerase I-like protein with 3'-5' exonuclease and polymerase domains|tara:strand:+ start:829 stop:2604 length:1776 start_codon:yes stop_codon:yes gene_type:complete
VKYVFDVESNGLLDSLNKIHCVVLKDIETEKLLSFTPDKVEEGLKLLSEADEICGHNIIKFDIPAIKKVYPDWNTKAKIVDTIICSRLIWADIKNKDFQNYQTYGFDSKMIGSHSLKAWGLRLNLHKGDYGQNSDWTNWNEDMQEYCERDVELTHLFYRVILSKKYSQEALDLEHQFAKVIFLQEQHGFNFNKEAAEKLLTDLIKRRLDLEEELQLAFPAWTKDLGEFIPARDNKTRGYIKGVAINKYETVTFNPNSRHHISYNLKSKYGWKPKEFTPDGRPQVDEKILSKLEYPEAKLLSEYLLIQKRISQLAEGNSAWLKLEKGNKIYGSVITNGAVTGRCTHKRPNIAQVPAVGVPFGKECRSLFVAPFGYKLVGVDFSGLELRCLAHYMARYDDGIYAKQVVEGDVHAFNQEAMGLSSRNLAKRVIYALIYGCGDRKMGEIINGTSKQGKELKEKLFKKLPALDYLTSAVRRKVESTGNLRGIDGRILNIRSIHSALNFLIQSCGSIIVKKATCLLHEKLFSKYKYGEDWSMTAHIHDELQLEVKENLVNEIGKLAIQAAKETKDYFNLRCALDAEYKVGNNWAETH